MPDCLLRQTQLETKHTRAQVWWLWLLCVLLFTHGARAATPTPGGDTNSPVAQALQKANKLFEAQQRAEARTAYDAARSLEKDWASPPVRLAVEGAVACSLKLSLWDDALSRAEDFVAKTKGKFEEAVGERFLAGLYLTVPHQSIRPSSKRSASALILIWPLPSPATASTGTVTPAGAGHFGGGGVRAWRPRKIPRPSRKRTTRKRDGGGV